MPPDSAQCTTEALSAGLLACMHRVLVVDLEIPSIPGSPLERFDARSDYPEGSVDALAAPNLSTAAALLPALSSFGAVFLFATPTSDELAAHQLISYVQWPGLTMAVRSDYDPTAHARALLRAGEPGQAYEILINIPPALITTPEAHAGVALEMQWCLLALTPIADPKQSLNFFFRAQEQFFLATTFAPLCIPSYLCHAKQWQRIGREDMARRLLRTVEAFDPTSATEEVLQTLDGATPPRVTETALEIDLVPGSVSLLVISHEGLDYGMDTLYDGLCDLLGDDVVVELPWKPTLHGVIPDDAGRYPCTFNRGGESRGILEIQDDLGNGRFDAILFCDTLKSLDVRGLRQLLAAAGDRPLFILDTWDEGGDYRDDLLAFMGRDTCDGYFKREMLEGVPYNDDTHPLPFAYSENLVPKTVPSERPLDVFWAGKPAAGWRPLYLSRLQEILARNLEKRYTQEEYRQALLSSRIGLNLFGYGFDTVRYWEVPAHGAMLLSERPPIRIPHNFVDGVHAVFFDDLPDLEQKLAYYREHEEEAAAIADAGRAHYLRHHTATARARQLLAHIAGRLGWSTS